MAGAPRIFISSSVYDKKEMLDQVYATLNGLGYEVWMSHKGIFPVHPKRSNVQNCLQAVEDCDLFLGIISGYYGSGVEPGSNSITHQELTKAIELDKMRWFLVDYDVLVVRNFLKAIKRLEKAESLNICSRLQFKPHDPISDIRVIGMYDDATRVNSGLDIAARTGNWVQQFRNTHEVLQFIKFQLGDPNRYTSDS